MNYFVKTGDEELGPFSLQEIQHRISSGEIWSTDFVRAEETADWVIVSELTEKDDLDSASQSRLLDNERTAQRFRDQGLTSIIRNIRS